ncbi:hypothetical protein [uncultured Polaribacter sp.]|uniref:hypothetical protein n=1 Tax=uncultured Polaribacter sp. TaxID=174711 RepID=UPI002638BAF1|nr:hypothetical protein [uncultured Polaribacter sp.]
MKHIKNIFIAIASIIAFTACESNIDTVAEIADEPGMIISVSASSDSSILGSPEVGVDLDDATVTITNAYLDYTIALASGTLDNISKIEIVKSFNGGEDIVLSETTTLPYNLVIDNLDDLISGIDVTVDDLRIGDVLAIKARVTQNDGDVYYYNSALEYQLVINCSSDLAGTYTVYYSSGSYTYTITELSPGKYQSDQMLGWPTSGYWVNFTDTCGILSMSINEWAFAGGYPITAEGYVDADGSLVWPSVSVEGIFDGYSYTMFKN